MSTRPPKLGGTLTFISWTRLTSRRAWKVRVLLNPPYVLRLLNIVLSALHLTDASRSSAAPEAPLPDFWEMAKEVEETLQDYIHNLLEAASSTYFESTQFTDIKSTMDDIVNVTAMFHDNINEALDAQNISFSTVSQEIEGIFMAIFSNLENSPTPDKVPGHAERFKIVDEIMDDVMRELVLLAARYGIEEGVVTSYIITLKSQVQALIITIGMLITLSVRGALNWPTDHRRYQ